MKFSFLTKFSELLIVLYEEKDIVLYRMIKKGFSFSYVYLCVNVMAKNGLITSKLEGRNRTYKFTEKGKTVYHYLKKISGVEIK